MLPRADGREKDDRPLQPQLHDEDDDDDINIMPECLYLCLSQKRNLFKTLSVFKVFCNFSCFQTLLAKVGRLDGYKVGRNEG